MLSSDSSEEDENPPEIIQSNGRDSIKVKHPGVPPPQHSTFATLAKHPKWPEDLWESGTIVYNVNSPERPKPPGDRSLVFDSHFESGNLALVYQISTDSYHCILEYDKNKSESCQWFYFKMSNIRANVKYTFYISGFHKSSGLFTSGSKVFWYSEKRFQKEGYSWSRGGTNYAYETTKGKKKGKKSTLQFQIKFPYDNDVVYLCYALPYTYSDLLTYINKWEAALPIGYFKQSVLGKTLGGRDCPLLQIAAPNEEFPIETRDCLFFTGRIHPGESNGSVVLHGLIDFLVSDAPGAVYLREHYLIMIVPMVNIDGVAEGFYRISLSGQDLNRVWKNPDKNLHPIVTKIKELILSIRKERNIAAYIDFHGHSRQHGTFAFGCPNDNEPSIRGQERLLPRMISFLCDAFSWSNCVFSYPKEREAASRIVVRTEANVVQSFTIETSFGGIQNGPRGGLLYDELIWKEIGANCGEALYHMFIGDDSPITSYVKDELKFLIQNPDEEEDPNKEDNYEYRFASPLPDQEVPPDPSKKGPQPMVKLNYPDTFVVAIPSIISDKPPGYCAPKWNQLKFSNQ